MRCNFVIDQVVGLEGDFGYLDVHNCYDLMGIETTFERRRVRFTFAVNEHATRGSPPEFALELSEVSVFEAHFGEEAVDALEIDEVTFRAPDDQELDSSGEVFRSPTKVTNWFSGSSAVTSALVQKELRLRSVECPLSTHCRHHSSVLNPFE